MREGLKINRKQNLPASANRVFAETRHPRRGANVRGARDPQPGARAEGAV